MKRLVITKTDAGQWIIENVAGVRTHGASLVSAFDKILPAGITLDEPVEALDALLGPVFDAMPEIRTGQIAHGQASG